MTQISSFHGEVYLQAREKKLKKQQPIFLLSPFPLNCPGVSGHIWESGQFSRLRKGRRCTALRCYTNFINILRSLSLFKPTNIKKGYFWE